MGSKSNSAIKSKKYFRNNMLFVFRMPNRIKSFGYPKNSASFQWSIENFEKQSDPCFFSLKKVGDVT